jgi:hypothetical protein
MLAQTAAPRAGSSQATPTGRINGTVQTSSGKPVANARVSINVRPVSPGVAFAVFNTTVATAADGTFSATAMPDGTYAVCPIPRDSITLPPCLWTNEPRVTVVNGQTVTVPKIQLQPSADLYVRVNDLKGNYAATLGKAPGASLMLAVHAPGGMLIPIPTTASDSAGFDAHLPIPPGTTVSVVVFSSYFSLTDSNGAAISKSTGLQFPVLIPASTAQYKTVINVN